MKICLQLRLLICEILFVDQCFFIQQCIQWINFCIVNYILFIYDQFHNQLPLFELPFWLDLLIHESKIDTTKRLTVKLRYIKEAHFRTIDNGMSIDSNQIPILIHEQK